MANERQASGGEFENPPTDSGGRGTSPQEFGDDAGEHYSPPDQPEGEAEAAAVTEAYSSMAGIPNNLLEIKRAIEEQMGRMLSQAAGPRALSALEGAGNVQGVAIGLGDGAHDSTTAAPGEPGLTVYVAEPTPVETIKAALVDSMGVRAAASDDVPIHVVVTGLIDAQPHRFRLRPAPGGVSVGHFRITAGTIGCLATGRSAPRNSRLLVLSNNHVLANSNGGAYGDCIAQPGPYDGGRCPQDQIAILERFVPINFGGATNLVDCATAWAWPDRVRRDLVYLSGGTPAFFRLSLPIVAPVLGMPVGKSGRTTQLTSGRVTGIGATINVNYGGGRVALFRDQIAIQAGSGQFSAGGDSGSSIWTWDARRNPLGLLFAGGGNTTFANRMTHVVNALDINLVL